MEMIVQNRKARYDYEIVETYEAGIKLSGLEVKAVRNHQMTIAEAWVKVEGNRASLIGASITCAKVPVWIAYNPTRERVLLLNKQQLKKLAGYLQTGLTIVPLRAYFNDRNIAKVEIGAVRGKKKHDKRRAIMEKDIKKHGY